jgi:MORN repeat
MHGKGVKVMANGDVFNGNWQNDKAEGAGVKVFACGGEYYSYYRYCYRSCYCCHCFVSAVSLYRSLTGIAL